MAFKEIINQVEEEVSAEQIATTTPAAQEPATVSPVVEVPTTPAVDTPSPVVDTPAPVVDTPAPVAVTPAPETAAPVEPASSPVVPVEPISSAPVSVDPTAASPVVPEVVVTEPVPECDLKCFRECLDLKKYVPFPVIQQCIEIRCYCQLDENAEKLSAISELYNFDAMTSTQQGVKGEIQGKGFLLNLIITVILLSVLSACIYVVYKLANKDEIMYTKHYDDEGDMVYTEQPGYQRIL